MACKFVPILFFVLSGFVVVIAVWVLLCGTQPVKPPKPILSFTPETVHFGTVSQGIEHGKAVVTNVSEKPVEIKAVSKGCDCSEVRIEQGELLPGDQREMAFQWDTRGRRGANAITISVHYTVQDEPKERLIPLIVKADIIPDYEIVPDKMEFASDKKDTQQITLTYKEGTYATIRDVEIYHPALSTAVSDDFKSPNATIAFDPEKWTDGTRYVQARIITTSENQPIFLLPISIRVVNSP
jgi:hypothetical protein